MDAIKVKLIGLSRGGGGNLQPDKTATPTKQEQTVRPDPGYDGLRQVTVEAIPDQFADVSGVDAGAGDVRVGKVIVGSDGETITGTMPPQKPEEIGYATPTEQAQTVTPTAGSVFSAFEVDAIPSEYADVSGVDATAADVRTGKIIVDAQGDTITGEMEPQKPEQSKSVVPTVSSQLVTPDPGYALSRVDVGAIPSEYADVSDVTATAGTVLTGSDFVDASGTLVHGACDYDADTSDADATAGQIEAGATAYVGGAKVTGTMPVRSADVEISDLSPVAIPAGSYDGATASAKLSSAAAAAVVASNIRQGAEILGVQGSYQGADTLGQYFDDTLTSVENDSVTSLIASMFAFKSSLISAQFPAATSIGAYCFRGCVNLEEVDIHSCTNLGDSSFWQCKIEEINIPLITRISTGAFQNCTRLATVVNSSLTQIGSGSFTGCSNLKNIDVGLVTIIGNGSFSGCSSLPETMSFPRLTSMAQGNPSIFNGSSVKHFAMPVYVSTQNYVANGAPFRFSNAESIDFGAITNIGTYTFADATHLTDVIIRTGSAATLGNINAFNNTPFASNGTGGTLYCPQSLISQYEQATNWSVILAYANNQILPIEGSPYEVTT